MHVQFTRAPYFTSELNRMELVSLTATSLTLYVAPFYISQLQDPRSKAALAILSNALLVGLLCVMAWFAWKILGASLRSWLRRIGAMQHTESRVRADVCCLYAINAFNRAIKCSKCECALSCSCN